MKTILSALAIAAASTVLADPVTSSNTFGILRVDSIKAQTIVSVPWEAASATGGAIKVKDVVKTANLTPASETYIGDQLYYYDTTAETPAYKMWRLTATGWEGATTVANGITPTAGSDEDTLARGGALILVRQNPATPFYLYGQYTTSPAQTICVPGGYTLLAPPTAGDCDLNSKTWTNVDAADRIGVPVRDSLALLKYVEGTGWCIKKGATLDTSKATVPAGQGVWYISAGENAPTINW